MHSWKRDVAARLWPTTANGTVKETERKKQLATKQEYHVYKVLSVYSRRMYAPFTAPLYRDLQEMLETLSDTLDTISVTPPRNDLPTVETQQDLMTTTSVSTAAEHQVTQTRRHDLKTYRTAKERRQASLDILRSLGTIRGLGTLRYRVLGAWLLFMKGLHEHDHETADLKEAALAEASSYPLDQFQGWCEAVRHWKSIEHITKGNASNRSIHAAVGVALLRKLFLVLHPFKYRKLRKGLKGWISELDSPIFMEELAVIKLKRLQKQWRPYFDRLTSLLGAYAIDFSDLSKTPCAEGTQQGVRADILAWMQDFKQPNVFWLQGEAGTGKSSIAATIIAEARASCNCHLAAVYLFNRFMTSTTDSSSFFPSLALQLCRDLAIGHEPGVSLLQELEQRPGRVSDTLEMQLEPFFLQPVRHIAALSGSTPSKAPGTNNPSLVPILVVVDALDECNPPTQEELARALAQSVDKSRGSLPVNVKILVTSRPDTGRFRPLQDLVDNKQALTKRLGVADPSGLKDIAAYMAHQLSTRKLAANDKAQIIASAGSSWIWASTVAAFLQDYRDLTPPQHYHLLQLVYDGRSEVYPLYATVLNIAYPDNTFDAAGNSRAAPRQLLGILLATSDRLSLGDLAALLAPQFGFEQVLADLCRLARRLRPLLAPTTALKDISAGIVLQPHKTVVDYMTGSLANFPATISYKLDVEASHKLLASACVKCTAQLTGDPCQTARLGLLNAEIADLAQRVARSVGAASLYASHFWIHHTLISSPSMEDFQAVLGMLKVGLLHWVELESLSSRLLRAPRDLKALCQLVKYISPKAEAQLNNILRFVLYFLEPARLCASEVYRSALAFCPSDSFVARNYAQSCTGMHVLRGHLKKWPAWDQTLVLSQETRHVIGLAWTPDSDKTIVVYPTTFDVFNSRTGTAVTTSNRLDPPMTVHNMVFSEDSRLMVLLGSHGRDAVCTAWDVNRSAATGSLRNFGRLTFEGLLAGMPTAVWTINGRRMLAVMERSANLRLISLPDMRFEREVSVVDSLREFGFPSEIKLTSGCVHPDGTVVVCNFNGDLAKLHVSRTLQLETQVIKRLQHEGRKVRLERFTDDAEYILAKDRLTQVPVIYRTLNLELLTHLTDGRLKQMTLIGAATIDKLVYAAVRLSEHTVIFINGVSQESSTVEYSDCDFIRAARTSNDGQYIALVTAAQGIRLLPLQEDKPQSYDITPDANIPSTHVPRSVNIPDDICLGDLLLDHSAAVTGYSNYDAMSMMAVTCSNHKTYVFDFIHGTIECTLPGSVRIPDSVSRIPDPITCDRSLTFWYEEVQDGWMRNAAGQILCWIPIHFRPYAIVSLKHGVITGPLMCQSGDDLLIVDIRPRIAELA